MATMSYCAIENTVDDLTICDEVLRDLIYFQQPIGDYEKRKLKSFIRLCREIVELYDEGINDGIITENGTLQSELDETDA